MSDSVNVVVVVPADIEAISEGLDNFLEWQGALHEPGCPGDDTCACCYRAANEAANRASKVLRHIADVVAEGGRA